MSGEFLGKKSLLERMSLHSHNSVSCVDCSGRGHKLRTGKSSS